MTKKCAESSEKKIKVVVFNAKEAIRKDDNALGVYLENIGIERKSSNEVTETSEGALE